MAALEAGELEGHEIRVPRRELRGPHFLRRVLAVAVLPGVANVHGVLDQAGLDVLLEQRKEDIVVDGQRLKRQDRIADLLEFLQDLVVDAGVVVVRSAQHDDADAVLGLEPFQDFPALVPQDFVHEAVLGFEALVHGANVLLPGKPEDIAELVIHLLGQQRGPGGVYESVEKEDIVLPEDVPFLDKSRLDGLRRADDGRAGAVVLHELKVARQVVDHGTEDDVERLFFVVYIEQIVYVRDAYFGGKAGVDGAALCAFLVKRLAGVVGVDQVFRRDAQRLEVGAEDGPNRVHVQDARDADAQLLAPLHQLDALLLLGGKRALGQGVRDGRRIVRLKGRLGPDLGQVRVFLLHSVETLLDLAHVAHVLDQALLATVADDEPLDAFRNRHL